MPDDGAATEAPRAAPDLPSDAPTLEARVLDQLFRSARTQNKWQDRPVPDATLQEQPSRAVQKACAREGIDPKDLDVVEFNEAFAAVAIVATRELGIDPERVNPNGGAIALGHPIGMSGARIVLDLALELRRRGGGVGAAALCGGGGQGDALILHVPAAG